MPPQPVVAEADLGAAFVTGFFSTFKSTIMARVALRQRAKIPRAHSAIEASGVRSWSTA